MLNMQFVVNQLVLRIDPHPRVNPPHQESTFAKHRLDRQENDAARWFADEVVKRLAVRIDFAFGRLYATRHVR